MKTYQLQRKRSHGLQSPSYKRYWLWECALALGCLLLLPATHRSIRNGASTACDVPVSRARLAARTGQARLFQVAQILGNLLISQHVHNAVGHQHGAPLAAVGGGNCVCVGGGRAHWSWGRHLADVFVLLSFAVRVSE